MCIRDRDVTSTPEQLGKPIGSDSENGKTTFVTLYGAEGAMQLAPDLNHETCAEPVSYTHLDVYKRQVQGSC